MKCILRGWRGHCFSFLRPTNPPSVARTCFFGQRLFGRASRTNCGPRKQVRATCRGQKLLFLAPGPYGREFPGHSPSCFGKRSLIASALLRRSEDSARRRIISPAISC